VSITSGRSGGWICPDLILVCRAMGVEPVEILKRLDQGDD